MENLSKFKCEACEGGVAPLTPLEYQGYLEQIPDWQVLEEKSIERDLAFGSFKEALSFVNRVGELAEDEGHHPNLYIYNYQRVKISLYTHAIGGLSLNDFIVAVKIDQLLKTD